MAALDLSDGYTTAEARQQVRTLLNEPTPIFWTNDEIDKWIQEACVDITTKTLCYEKSDFITLVSTPVLTYGALQGGDSIDDIIKIYSVVYYNTANTYRGLNKIHPRHIQHLSESTAGEPYYWYHFGDELGIFPMTNAAIVTAGGKVKVFYSMADETITNLPYYYQLPAIIYAVAMARRKQRSEAEAMQLYRMYANSLSFYRVDLYERGVDSKDMFEIPDLAVEVR
jgi:hypothetical protein